MKKQLEFLISIKRYYRNAFTDRAKQDAMNIFLGYFVPTSHGTQLWDLETDYFLHNTHVQNAGLQSMREYKKDQYFLDQDEVRARFRLCALLTRQWWHLSGDRHLLKVKNNDDVWPRHALDEGCVMSIANSLCDVVIDVQNGCVLSNILLFVTR